MSNSSIDWRRRSRCGDPDVDPDMWFATELATKRFAQHLCLHHCPVLEECQGEMGKFSHRGVVIGGVIWSEREGVKVNDSKAPVICYICRTQPVVVPTGAFAAWR